MQSRKPVTILLINAIAILSEDRFLARSTFYILLRSTLGRKRIQHLPPPSLTRGVHTKKPAQEERLTNIYTYTVGFSAKSYDPAFGQSGPDQSVKGKIISLIASVRMIMRGAFLSFSLPFLSPKSADAATLYNCSC